MLSTRWITLRVTSTRRKKKPKDAPNTLTGCWTRTGELKKQFNNNRRGESPAINKKDMKTIKIIISILFISGAFAFSGRVDYSEEIVMNMPQEAYEAIVVKLPNGASDYEIACEYMNNKKYYDKMSY